jgi:hypothetical protein
MFSLTLTPNPNPRQDAPFVPDVFFVPPNPPSGLVCRTDTTSKTAIFWGGVGGEGKRGVYRRNKARKKKGRRDRVQ